MLPSNYQVKVFDDIENEELKSAWLKLQNIAKVHPQMYLEWLKPWVKLRLGKRRLHIVTVTHNDRIIAIAPFCKEKKLGVNILASIPIHYGDKYEILVSPDYDYKSIGYIIFGYVRKERGYRIVQFNQVESESNLYNALESYNSVSKLLINCPVSDFTSLTFEEYMMLLNRKVRNEYRRGKRRNEEVGALRFEIHRSKDFYLQHENDFRALYEKRWKNIDKHMPDDDYYNCRRESFVGILDKDKALIVVLKIEDKLVGYRLGFIENRCYYDWKICVDVEYKNVAYIMTGELIKYLIHEQCDKINHGPGDYSYKKEWCVDGAVIKNHTFFIRKGGVLARLYVMIELKYKDSLKQGLSKLNRLWI